MGKIRTDMADLVEEIRSSIGLRHSKLDQIHEGACGLLGQDRRERGERARALHEQAQTLAIERARQAADRRRAARSMQLALKRGGEARRASVGAGRRDCRTRLNRYHAERSRMSRESKARIGADVAATREAVGVLRAAVDSTMRNIGTDVRGAVRLWRQRGHD